MGIMLRMAVIIAAGSVILNNRFRFIFWFHLQNIDAESFGVFINYIRVETAGSCLP
jgi:hypothetical protein